MLFFCFCLQTAAIFCVCGLAVFFVILLFIKIVAIKVYSNQKKHRTKSEAIVGFFHPYCNAGGGGERVLWCAVRSIQKKYPLAQCVVYTGDVQASEDSIVKKAEKTFGITLINNVKFVYLYKRPWVEAKKYPILTLLCQSLGSMVLGIEALLCYPPDLYFDTMGYAFTLPIFKYLGGCYTGCYVHYPTISTDMLQVVESRNPAFNNRPIIAKSKVLTHFKLLYYKAFAWIYGLCGRCANVVMVNSSWTAGHIEQLWKREESVLKIFPPCDIRGFLQLPFDERYKQPTKLVLSIGQFRPEKNHSLQIEVFHSFLSKVDKVKRLDYQLVLAGGCRNEGDRERVAELQSLIAKLKISDHVQIKTNISFDELKDLLQRAHVGLHTMANEHFGIGVVEFQAAGVIALAHNSGGPRMDIVQKDNTQKRTGFLADTVQSYGGALEEIFRLTREERTEIVESARKACERFSEEQFEKDFLRAVSGIFSAYEKYQ